MKKKLSRITKTLDDDMRPEYDFSGGVRGKYAKALREEGYTIRVYAADGTYTETRVVITESTASASRANPSSPDRRRI